MPWGPLLLSAYSGPAVGVKIADVCATHEDFRSLASIYRDQRRAEIAPRSRRDGAHPPHAVGRYILRLNASGRPLVLLHDTADAADALRAHLQCQLLRKRAAESGAPRGTPGLAAALGTCALRLLGARRFNPPKLSDSEVVALGETARAAARGFDALRAALIATGWAEAGLRADISTTWRYREVGEGGVGARPKAA